MNHPRARWLAPPLSLLIAAGCTTTTSGGPGVPAGAGSAAATAVTFGGCDALTAPPRPSSATPSPAPPIKGTPTQGTPAQAPGRLPDVTLPCFAGGQPVSLTRVSGPAVLNLWASSCGPCREELPAVQRLADRTAGRLHVVGVDTGDERDAAASFGADVGMTVPNLFDPGSRLLAAVGRRALPATVFVDATGRTYVYNGPALDDAALTDLAREHTGVAVPS